MITFNNKVVTYNHKWINGNGSPLDPYNPLNLPNKTIRVRFRREYTPTPTSGVTLTLVDQANNVWDIHKGDSNWSNLFGFNGPGHLLEVLGANTTGVTKMNLLFFNARYLTSIPLFDTSNVTEMSRMFGDCVNLETVPLYNTSNVTDMSIMFSGCESLTTVPLFDTSSVTNIDGMFGDCYSLTTVPLFNTSNVTNMSQMFFNCESLTTVPLFDTSNVTDMGAMFYDCINLTSVPLYNTSKVIDVDEMFFRCYEVESGALALYQQMSTQVNPPISHTQTFYDCGSNTQTGSVELAQIPSDWK